MKESQGKFHIPRSWNDVPNKIAAKQMLVNRENAHRGERRPGGNTGSLALRGVGAASTGDGGEGMLTIFSFSSPSSTSAQLISELAGSLGICSLQLGSLAELKSALARRTARALVCDVDCAGALEAISYLRVKLHSDLPVIALTDNPVGVNLEKLIALGVDQVIRNAHSTREIAARVGVYLR